MANKSETLSTPINFREFLVGLLNDANKFFYYKENDTEVVCYNINVIWTGTNFCITYTENNDGGNNFIKNINDISMWGIKTINPSEPTPPSTEPEPEEGDEGEQEHPEEGEEQTE